jgi:hypothetical protein
MGFSYFLDRKQCKKCKLWLFEKNNFGQILKIRGDPYVKKSQYFFAQEITQFTHQSNTQADKFNLLSTIYNSAKCA